MSAIVKKLQKLSRSELTIVNQAVESELARRTDVHEAKQILWKADNRRPARSVVTV